MLAEHAACAAPLAAARRPAGNEKVSVVRWMVVRTQQQDFAEFYSSAADECLRTVAVSIGDPDTAQELVDEAFARAWSSWRTVSRHPAPKAWVVRTALNAGVSRWRRRRREVSVPDPARAADLPAARGAFASQVDPQIMAALMRLPARQREVVALRLILDLDTAGTAQLLGIAPGTVMAHMGRAMAALRLDLQPELQQENRS
jgi:RNA polymerase sigma factor (sigma-70 family)